MVKKIISLVMVFVITFSLPVTCYAVETASVGDFVVGVFDSFLSKSSLLYQAVKALLADGVTEDTATPEDWQNAYREYSKQIQRDYGATTVGSDGALYFVLSHSYCSIWNEDIGDCSHKIANVNPKYVFSCGDTYSSIFCSDSSLVTKARGARFYFTAFAPIEGYYSIYSLPALGGEYGTSSTSDLSFSDSFFKYPVLGVEGYRTVGAAISYDVRIEVSRYSYAYVQYICDGPFIMRVRPASGLVDVSTGDIGVDSRVGSIVGDFGILGDNGTIIKSDTQYIVNETNNTVYNPVTGDTSVITDWTYDYSDRSYNLTLESGDTMTVTYGDEHVTIKQGDTINNVYYITNNGGGTVDPTPHVHSYTPSVTQEPTCIAPGLRTFTCSCGESYTENIPAAGHKWAVKETVSTEYNEDGTVKQEGYTIWKCSVCGEEYRSDNNTGPPSGGGSGGGSSEGVFSGIFGIVWDFFSFMFDFFAEFVVGGIKGFISSLLDGASDFFGILNPVGWFT